MQFVVDLLPFPSPNFFLPWFMSIIAEMVEARDNNEAYEEELLDYEEEEEKAPDSVAAKAAGEPVKK